ncbi:MAG: nucleoid occlusion factor SlmA [Burkholderiaceae bacterium]|nr:nucleoid occlusion factor SlmA [Burkholderiaceae bacterium]
MPTSTDIPAVAGSSVAPKRRRRKRLKPGERRVQILQTLAHMLEERNSERVTTAQLAARLQISEAALYRHFTSKTQMFEALIGLVESYVSGLIAETAQASGPGSERATQLATRLLSFAEENPGLARILTGGALVHEHARLQARMNALLERFEATLRQCLEADSTSDFVTRTELLATFTFGRIHLWSRSGFKRSPTANLAVCLTRLMG